MKLSEDIMQYLIKVAQADLDMSCGCYLQIIACAVLSYIYEAAALKVQLS